MSDTHGKIICLFKLTLGGNLLQLTYIAMFVQNYVSSTGTYQKAVICFGVCKQITMIGILFLVSDKPMIQNPFSSIFKKIASL